MSDEKILYEAEQLPAFQNKVFHSREDAIACAKGNVTLVQDHRTGLIHNRSFEPSLMQYDPDYQNEQGFSAAFKSHLESVISLVDKHFSGLTLIEVGCGKGSFLEQLQDRGFEITGLDPAYEGSNPSIIREYFTPDTGLRADGIILRHVIEHIQDPVAFLFDLRNANGGRGKIYIETPCLEWIREHRAWFDVFYEHVNYFRLSDFSRMFGEVHEMGHSFNGQYLSVVAELGSLRVPTRSSSDEFTFPADFSASISSHAKLLQSRPGGRRAVWGAASKGVTFSLLMQRAGAKVDAAVDTNPAKQGKFLAASGIEVWPPEKAIAELPDGADILVMNSNYLDEIAASTGHRFNYLAVDGAGA